MSGQRYEQMSAFDMSKRSTASSSTPPMKRSQYWVFDRQQLGEALDAFIQSREEPPSREVVEGIYDFLESDECAERGMRRGGTDDTWRTNFGPGLSPGMRPARWWCIHETTAGSRSLSALSSPGDAAGLALRDGATNNNRATAMKRQKEPETKQDAQCWIGWVCLAGMAATLLSRCAFGG